MRKLANILLIAAAVLISACEGPAGPPGEDGYNFIGSVFEIEGDFTSSNDYSLFVDYPSGLTVYDSDVVLVYILWETENGLDVWRLMPQTVVLDNGVIQYNYDYTVEDVQLFLEFTIPENELNNAETQDQIFRIAVLPADFAARTDINIEDFNSIMSLPEIRINDIGTFDANKLNVSK